MRFLRLTQVNEFMLVQLIAHVACYQAVFFLFSDFGHMPLNIYSVFICESPHEKQRKQNFLANLIVSYGNVIKQPEALILFARLVERYKN